MVFCAVQTLVQAARRTPVKRAQRVDVDGVAYDFGEYVAYYGRACARCAIDAVQNKKYCIRSDAGRAAL